MDPHTHDLTPIIIATTYTTSEARERLALLRRFLEDVFFGSSHVTPTAERLAEFLDAEGVAMSTQRVLTTWLKTLSGALSRESLYDVLLSIERSVSALPVLGVISPVALSERETAHLGVWAREHVRERVLIDFRVDPAAVGGCRLLWDAHSRDFSLGYFVEKHRDEIVEDIRAVFARKGSVEATQRA